MKAKLPSSRPRRGAIISGAHGMGNIGDEAALSGILSDLRSLDPSMPICVLSRNPKETAARHGVNSVHSFNLPALWRALGKSALFISGGGTLIQDVSSTRSLLYYLLCLRLAKKRRCAVMMYGCGIGPVCKKSNRRRAARVIERCVDAITLRDGDSLYELKALGVSSPEILPSIDPAIFIDNMDSEALDALMKSCGLKDSESYICFCLRPWGNFSQAAELFAGAADYAFERHGLKSVFLPMNHSEDALLARKVAALCRHAPVILDKSLSAVEAAGLISRMDVLVGMRLHALVFAAKNAVPTVGISYDPKVAAFLKYIGRGNFVEANALTDEKLFAMIDAAAASLPGTNEMPEEIIAELKWVSRHTAARLLAEFE